MNITGISAVLADRLQLQREQLSMTLMKNQIQAEQAMAQMLMEAAKNVEQVTASSAETQGSIVNLYV